VPTKAQWDGVVANNTLTNVGGFYDSVTNYGAGKKFGDQLMLPAAGVWDFANGSLRGRGDFGDYWSSTEYDNVYAYCLYLSSSGTYTYFDYRTYGFSVRCIAE
jgi:uncharacterized protein (TIGR02145 family)